MSRDIVTRLDAADAALSKIGARLDRLASRRRADAGQYPVLLTLELTQWENLGSLIEFLKYVRASANGGHSFGIGADSDADGPGLKELGKQKFGAVVFVDGDGNDHIGRMFLNDEEIK